MPARRWCFQPAAAPAARWRVGGRMAGRRRHLAAKGPWQGHRRLRQARRGAPPLRVPSLCRLPFMRRRCQLRCRRRRCRHRRSHLRRWLASSAHGVGGRWVGGRQHRHGLLAAAGALRRRQPRHPRRQVPPLWRWRCHQAARVAGCHSRMASRHWQPPLLLHMPPCRMTRHSCTPPCRRHRRRRRQPRRHSRRRRQGGRNAGQRCRMCRRHPVHRHQRRRRRRRRR